MKAIVQSRYGAPEEVLSLQEIDMPVVGVDDVLVRVRAAAMHADIWHVVEGLPYPLRLMMGNRLRKPGKPVPGTDLAGHVERVGKNVTRFKSGDEVFGGVGLMRAWGNGGAFAEYAAFHQDGLALKPACATFEQAASVPLSAEIGLLNLGPADQLAGRKVLINGSGGAVGCLAIQIAKAAGATVTGVDSADKLAIMSQLGVDQVIDYAREDFTRGSERYDLILDIASTLMLDDCRRALTPAGKYVFIGHAHFNTQRERRFGAFPRILSLTARSFSDNNLRKVTDGFKMPDRRQITEKLRALLESGTLTPIIAKTFPLAEVPAAMRCMIEGRTLGRIVIQP